MCASMDGEWLFLTTDDGLLKVLKREKPPMAKKGKRQTQGKTSPSGTCANGGT